MALSAEAMFQKKKQNQQPWIKGSDKWISGLTGHLSNKKHKSSSVSEFYD